MKNKHLSSAFELAAGGSFHSAAARAVHPPEPEPGGRFLRGKYIPSPSTRDSGKSFAGPGGVKEKGVPPGAVCQRPLVEDLMIRGAFWVKALSIIALGSVLSLSPLLAAAPEDTSPLASGDGDFSYKIGPENLLHIKIFGEGSLQQTYRVDETGNITHPLLGRVHLSGQTVGEAEETLKKRLEQGYIVNPQVSVFVLEHSHFSIMGEVQNAGMYEVTGQLSFIEAVSMAGGFTPLADKGKVKLLRQGVDSEENAVIVDVNGMMDGRSADKLFVEGGDVIVVPKSFF